MPTISIIIASFNSAADIRTAIQSVLAMTYPDWELLVIDGASTDGTCDVVREYAKRDGRIHLYSEPDRGTYDAFNKGWQRAQGTWVHYLGSDDSMTTDGLAELLSRPVADDVDVVSGHCWALKIDGTRKPIVSHGFYGCHQGKLTRRSALAAMDGFDLTYPILADMDLYYRLRLSGHKAENRDCYVANFKMDGNSQRFSHQWAFAKEMYSIYKKDPAERFPALHTLRYTGHTCLSILYRMMRKKLTTGVIALAILPLQAQSHLTTDITFEGVAGNGDHAAYYLTANRHGSLATQPRNALLRAALQGSFDQGEWHYSYGLDVTAQRDDYSPCYVQQLYGRTQWRDFYVELGAREHDAALRNQRLSSGSLLWSGNSRPIPQLRLGTDGFWTVPGTCGWLQVMLDGDYGYFMDSDYLRERYDEYNPGGSTLTGYAQSFVTTGAWHHQKRLFLRTNPDKTLVGALGIEHAVQFGGTTINYVNNTINGKLEQRVGFMDFVKVLIPSGGDADAAVGDQNFIYGNHLGNVSAQLTWNFDAGLRQLTLYGENPFEDGSGFCKRNGWDGLWGVEYKTEKRGYVDGLVLEYLQTTDQSGAIHWAPQDHYDELRGEARGADEYYNNYFYCGYAHFGQSMGTPMLKSPLYNADSYLRFTDNRVKAWHMGVEGTFYDKQLRGAPDRIRCLSYRCLLSYRNSYGTMAIPARHVRHELSSLVELSYSTGFRRLTLSFGHDDGSLMGNSNSLHFSYTYHGKIL